MALVNSWRSALRARLGLIVAALLLTSALTVSHATGTAGPGGRPTDVVWRTLGVEPMEMDFADLRSITHRLPCVRAGKDVYADGACDPWGRPFNYPAVWLAPAWLGWGPEATRPAAACELMLLFAALWTLLPVSTWKGSLAVGVTVLSPPVMFAVERGNIDMLMFAGLVLGLWSTRRLPDDMRDASRLAMISGLAFLKVFPIAAFVILARSRNGALKALAGAAATAGAMVLVYRGTLPLLQKNTVHEFSTNYGRMLLFAPDPGASAWTSPGGVFSLLLALGVAVSAAGLGVLHRQRVRAAWGDLLSGDLTSDAAAAGVAIFGFTFLLGSNYDYRLVFLLMVLPIWLRMDAQRWSTPAGGAAAVVMLRLMFAHRCPDAWLAVMDWGLFAFACAWMAASMWDRVVVTSSAPRVFRAAPFAFGRRRAAAA